LVDEHSVQAPAKGPAFWQAGRVGSGQLGAPSAVHGAHVCVVAEQTGVVPPQSALPRQATQTPPPPVVSQSGVAAPQRLVSIVVHCAHAPVDRHTGNAGSQSALVRHTRHEWAVGSQMGRVPEQSPFERHSTQVLDVGSQTSCAAVQALASPAPQTTQAPVAAQTDAAAPHSASAPQARQTCAVESQTGVAPPQSADVTHETQIPPAVSHNEVAPAQAAVFVAEHAPQAPDGWQAVSPAVPQSPSATQPRQACVTPSQTGEVADPHWASARQDTQTPAVTSQSDVTPAQPVEFVAEHAPHAPEGWQAGVAAPQSVSPTHARQVLVPVSQTGFVPPH
jgi:hypothetical protein